MDTVDGVAEAAYTIDVPITCSNSAVCDTDLTEVETDSLETVTVKESEGIIRITGRVGGNGAGTNDPTNGDIWNVYDAGEYKHDDSDTITAKTSLRDDYQNCYVA